MLDLTVKSAFEYFSTCYHDLLKLVVLAPNSCMYKIVDQNPLFLLLLLLGMLI
jgi:hypothetical protein